MIKKKRKRKEKDIVFQFFGNVKFRREEIVKSHQVYYKLRPGFEEILAYDTTIEVYKLLVERCSISVKAVLIDNYTS